MYFPPQPPRMPPWPQGFPPAQQPGGEAAAAGGAAGAPPQQQPGANQLLSPQTVLERSLMQQALMHQALLQQTLLHQSLLQQAQGGGQGQAQPQAAQYAGPPMNVQRFLVPPQTQPDAMAPVPQGAGQQMGGGQPQGAGAAPGGEQPGGVQTTAPVAPVAAVSPLQLPFGTRHRHYWTL